METRFPLKESENNRLTSYWNFDKIQSTLLLTVDCVIFIE